MVVKHDLSIERALLAVPGWCAEALLAYGFGRWFPVDPYVAGSLWLAGTIIVGLLINAPMSGSGSATTRRYRALSTVRAFRSFGFVAHVIAYDTARAIARKERCILGDLARLSGRTMRRLSWDAKYALRSLRRSAREARHRFFLAGFAWCTGVDITQRKGSKD